MQSDVAVAYGGPRSGRRPGGDGAGVPHESLHWVQKYRETTVRTGLKQYKYMCYTDVLALYYEDGSATASLPPGHGRRVPVVNAAL